MKRFLSLCISIILFLTAPLMHAAEAAKTVRTGRYPAGNPHFKYLNKKFSMVIAMDNPALEFAIDSQSELFGDAPIVFCGINNYTPSLLKGRADVTGIVEAVDIAGTIEVMLRLHPDTLEIFNPHDYTATGLAVSKEVEALTPRKTVSLGLELVNILVGQMNGTIDMRADGGPTWTITFPVKSARKWRDG